MDGWFPWYSECRPCEHLKNISTSITSAWGGVFPVVDDLKFDVQPSIMKVQLPCHASLTTSLYSIFRVSCPGLDHLYRPSLRGVRRYPRPCRCIRRKPRTRHRRDDPISTRCHLQHLDTHPFSAFRKCHCQRPGEFDVRC